MPGHPEFQAPRRWDGDPVAKRGSFRLRKWYFDFLTPGLDYCYIYYADVCCLGMTFRHLTVHLARPGNGSPITKTLAVEHARVHAGEDEGCTLAFAGGEIDVRRDRGTIDVSTPGCSARLRYVSWNGFRPQPVVIRSGGRGRILWKPVHMKSIVSGSVMIGDDTVNVEGCDGYIDYLESSYLPPAVPVRTLYWGRLHHPELDLVFMRAADGPGSAAWSRLSMRAGKSVTECEEVAIMNTWGLQESPSHALSPGGYDARAACGSRRIQVSVHHSAAVQESSFIDHRDMKSSAVRYALKKLTRDPRSTKWLSYADVTVVDERTTKKICGIPFIDEFALL